MHNKFPIKYYFINSLDTNLIKKVSNKTGLIFRNYSQKNLDENKILLFKKNCKKKNIKFFISNNFKLAIKLGLDGAYIPAFNKNLSHLSYNYQKKFLILGSAHNIKQVRQKEIQNVSLIFISSLFKKNRNFLGINKFKNLSNLTSKKVVALGGISKSNVKKLKLVKCDLFAGISFFE